MQIGAAAGLAASIAGQALAQRAGAEGEQAAEGAASARQTDNQDKAEASAGIGETDTDDQQAHERDADGRQVLMLPAPAPAQDEEASDEKQGTAARRSPDPSGDCGEHLDLLA